MASNSIPYCGKIAAAVKKKEAAGVSRTAIFAYIQTYQNAPRSMTTFYKLYRQDMDSVHADTVEQIGGKVIEQAKNGDWKSQELYLKTKGGWKTSEEEREEEKDKESGAVAKLVDYFTRNKG